MSVVTKQGDGGKTRLFSGEEVSKADPRIELLGALDELVAHLGLARSLLAGNGEEAVELKNLMLVLFRLGSEVASGASPGGSGTAISESDVLEIEERITALEKEGVRPRSFILPGSCQSSAALDIARATARRLERRLVSLAEAGSYKNPQGIVYLNRLSDCLFLLARAAERRVGAKVETVQGER